MKVLCIHQNFPGQYKHLAPALAQQGHQVVGLGEVKQRPEIPGVQQISYNPPQPGSSTTHHYLQGFEGQVRRGQQVLRSLQELQKKGFTPDLILAHPGWGEALYVKDIFPTVPLIGLFEFYYHGHGHDVGFDPEFPLNQVNLDKQCKIRTRNVNHLLALEAVDMGVCPTIYQKSVHPAVFHSKLQVIHDGINTHVACPDSNVTMTLNQNGEAITLTRQSEVITFVSRNLEHYRGFHIFMRALPSILNRRPQAHVVIVGGDSVSYGPAAPKGKTWKQIYLDHVQDQLDLNRVYLFDRLLYNQLIQLFQLSSVHVYLTYPFVLSWSVLEAMSCGCLVVGSRTAPVQEVIRDGENGFLVNFFSPEEICDRINQVLDSPDRMQQIRDHARQDVITRYDLHQVCLPQQLDLIHTVMAERQGKTFNEP
ncbi:MAG TPA: glycosyltransferase family 4 protein [Coleofasciculaceae cyanobacterium]